MEKESTQKLAQARKGCIKTTMGPWIARRIGADGVERTSLRRPSPAEREKNRQRERHRRSVKARIYSCLRAYGNYRLPKHPDHNDILMALCQEAGWHVEEDGTIYRKENTPGTSKTASVFDCEVGLFGQGDEEKCQYGVDVGFGAADHQDELSLTLSLRF